MHLARRSCYVSGFPHVSTYISDVTELGLDPGLPTPGLELCLLNCFQTALLSLIFSPRNLSFFRVETFASTLSPPQHLSLAHSCLSLGLTLDTLTPRASLTSRPSSPALPWVCAGCHTAVRHLPHPFGDLYYSWLFHCLSSTTILNGCSSCLPLHLQCLWLDLPGTWQRLLDTWWINQINTFCKNYVLLKYTSGIFSSQWMHIITWVL